MSKTFTFILLILYNVSFGQYLSLDELLVYQKSSDVFIEQSLTLKKWKLDATKVISVLSTKTGGIEGNQMTYSYNRNVYDSKAEIWFSVLRRDDDLSINDSSGNDEPVCRLTYQLHNTVAYGKLLQRAKVLGFTTFKSWINDEDNSFVKFLGNKKSKMVLQIISKKYIDATGANINSYEINVISSGDYFFNYSE